jgi:hypothetical protein
MPQGQRPAGAEPLRGELDLLVDRGDRRRQLQNRERQHVLGEPEQHRRVVVEQLEGTDAEDAEQLVDQTLAAEHDRQP